MSVPLLQAAQLADRRRWWLTNASQQAYSVRVRNGPEVAVIRETSYTQARERFAALLDQVTDTREPVLIKRRGKESVALIAADELAGWLETAHLLRSPKNARRLLEATGRAEVGDGEAVTVEDLRQRLGLAGA